MKTKLTLAFLALFIGVQITTAQEIIYGGPVEGLWSYDNSPYIIRGSIYIDDHKTLRIEAGVNVIFETTDPFLVNGSLIAEGNSSDTILFSTNIPDRGWGGIRFEDILSGNEDSQLSYCKFEYASASGEWPYHSGGAIGIKYANNISIQNCLFENNRALAQQGNGPKNNSGGGAIAIWLSEVRLSKNVFRYNESVNGGALFIDKYSKAVIDNSLFYENTASNSGGAAYISDHATPTFINCTFTDNYSNSKGGAIGVDDGANPSFVNSIIWGNSAFEEGDQINIRRKSAFNLVYSNIEGGLQRIAGYYVDDNTNMFYEYDPQFVNSGPFPYALAESSSCIDIGTLSGLFMPQDYQHPSTDLHDNKRITGNTIDIGYFENETYPVDPPVNIDQVMRSGSEYSDWEIVEHTGIQNDFIAISFPDDDNGYVLAEDGMMLFTKDGGLSWEEKYFGPSVNFQDVQFIDNRSGFVVGSIDIGPVTKGFIYRTTDGGETWNLKYSSESQMILKSVTVSSMETTYVTGTVLSPSGSETITLVTNDGGHSWSPLRRNSSQLSFSQITFINDIDGWATGSIQVGPADVNIVAKSDNGGRSWETAYFDISEIGLNDISFFDSQNGLVIGELGSVLLTHDGGKNWMNKTLGEYQFNATLSGSKDQAWVVGNNGIILSTYNTGNDWVEEYTLLETNLNDICNTPNGLLWIAGDDGTLYVQKPKGIDVNGNSQTIDNFDEREVLSSGQDPSTNNEKVVGPLVRHKNYPNPFAYETTISFELDQSSDIQLKVYTISGKLVVTMVDQFLDEGIHNFRLDASGLAPGIYTYIVTAGNSVTNGKMILNK